MTQKIKNASWSRKIIWIVLTLILFVPGFIFAFFNWQTILVAFLLYLPLTIIATFWMAIRKSATFKVAGIGLWLVVLLGWLTYIGPFVQAIFDNIPPGDF